MRNSCYGFKLRIYHDYRAACEKMKSINKDPETITAIQLEIDKCNEELSQLDTDLKQYEVSNFDCIFQFFAFKLINII